MGCGSLTCCEQELGEPTAARLVGFYLRLFA